MRFAGAALAGEDDRVAVGDPGALGERGDRRLRHVGVVVEAEVVEPFQQGEAGVEEPPSFAALGSLLHLALEQRGEVGERRLLGAGRFGGERAEAAADGRQVQLGGVRVDERLERREVGLRAHDVAPRLSSRS